MPLARRLHSAPRSAGGACDFSLSARTSWMSCAPRWRWRGGARGCAAPPAPRRAAVAAPIATTPTRRPCGPTISANDLSRSMRAQSGSASPGLLLEAVGGDHAALRGHPADENSRSHPPQDAVERPQPGRARPGAGSSSGCGSDPPARRSRSCAGPHQPDARGRGARLRVSASVTAARMRSRWNALETFSTTRSAPRSARTVASGARALLQLLDGARGRDGNRPRSRQGDGKGPAH